MMVDAPATLPVMLSEAYELFVTAQLMRTLLVEHAPTVAVTCEGNQIATKLPETKLFVVLNCRTYWVTALTLTDVGPTDAEFKAPVRQANVIEPELIPYGTPPTSHCEVTVTVKGLDEGGVTTLSPPIMMGNQGVTWSELNTDPKVILLGVVLMG